MQQASRVVQRQQVVAEESGGLLAALVAALLAAVLKAELALLVERAALEVVVVQFAEAVLRLQAAVELAVLVALQVAEQVPEV